MNKDSIILSYNDILLRRSDVDLLLGPHWLNDNIISFYFEYLNNHFKEFSHILFVSPEVTQCIKIMPVSQMNVFLEPLDCDNKKFIFFALNDNERPQTVGGTHWSLLLFSRLDKTVFHYDSCRGSNIEQAQNFANKLFSYYQVKIGAEFKEEATMQQRNSYDCGIFLIFNAENLAKHLVTFGSVKNYHGTNENFRNAVENMRTCILNVIEKLKQ